MSILADSSGAYARAARAARPEIARLAAVQRRQDPFTFLHQKRTAALAVAIGELVGLSAAQLELVHLAATVHDIGKMAVPRDIVYKPDCLSESEYQVMQTHSARGADMLRHLDWMLPLAEIILQHHERLDGSGYPRGLAAGSIMKEAQILAVADVFDAMVSHRVYRPARPEDEALEELHAMAGRTLDEDAVHACTQHVVSRREDVSRFICTNAAASVPAHHVESGRKPFGIPTDSRTATGL
jgi:putative nucleotidyltransferase with HDIG domain